MALNHLYGGNLKPGMTYNQSSLFQFDQNEFFNNRPGISSMDEKGYVYIPVDNYTISTNLDLNYFFL